MAELDNWLSKVSTASNSLEVFKLLDDFRQNTWTDEECAKMSKTYIGVLDRLGALEIPNTASPTKGQAVVSAKADETVELVADEEVWYEKM